MHEKLIEAADALEAQIRAVKPRTVYLEAAANTCHGIRDHLRSDQKAVEAAEVTARGDARPPAEAAEITARGDARPPNARPPE